MKPHLRRFLISALLGLTVGAFAAPWLRSIKQEPVVTLSKSEQTSLLAPKASQSASAAWREFIAKRAPATSAANAEQFRHEREGDLLKRSNPFHNELRLTDRLHSLPLDVLETLLRQGEFDTQQDVGEGFARLAREKFENSFDALAQAFNVMNRDQRQAAIRAVIKEGVNIGPSEMIAIFEHLGDMDVVREMSAEFAQQWITRDPFAAMNHLSKLESLAGTMRGRGLAQNLLAAWFRKDPEAAASWVSDHAPTDRKDAFSEQLTVLELSNQSPHEAINHILKNPEKPALQGQLAAQLRRAFGLDAAATMDQLANIPSTHLLWMRADDLAFNAVIMGGMDDAASALALAEKLPHDRRRDGFLAGLVSYGASNDLDFALQVLPALQEGREREQAIGSLTELWMRQDPVALSKWLGGLEASRSKDRAVSRFVKMLSSQDPERARAWAETLSDPTLRERIMAALPSE